MNKIYVEKLPETCRACNCTACDYKIMYNHLDKRDKNCPLRLVEDEIGEYKEKIEKLEKQLEHYKSKAILTISVEKLMQEHKVKSLQHLKKLLNVAHYGKLYLKRINCASFRILLGE